MRFKKCGLCLPACQSVILALDEPLGDEHPVFQVKLYAQSQCMRKTVEY